MTAEVAKKELERLQNLFKREPYKGAPLNLSRSRDKSVGEAPKLTPDDALAGVWCLVDLPAGISCPNARESPARDARCAHSGCVRATGLKQTHGFHHGLSLS